MPIWPCQSSLSNMWIIFRELNANSVRFSVAAPPSSIFTEESSSNSMTRKDEIKAMAAEPASPPVVVQNGKENIQKTEKEMVPAAKTNMIQRASDQKRYKTIGCKLFLLLNHRGHIRINTLCRTSSNCSEKGLREPMVKLVNICANRILRTNGL